MFVRSKKRGERIYLQVVENFRDAGRTRQRVLFTIGRLDQLQENGKLDGLLRSGARFSEKVSVLEAARKGNGTKAQTFSIGPSLVFGKLWKDLGIDEAIQKLLHGRRHKFSIERAIFLTVLHRLFKPGSDRAAEKWKESYRIPGVESINLQHLYRAMGWLGEPLEISEQVHATPFGPRCRKDLLEENLFAGKRDLFTNLDLVFFDTTSIYFEGAGGETLGRHGHSKDHRPDLKQMVVGVVMDNAGNPVCSEMWPGNVTDVTTLIPIVDRLRKRFSIGEVCVVADRGMISKSTISTLESDDYRIKYILGVRMRKTSEAKKEVLSRPGRFREVSPERKNSKDPSPLKVKQVNISGRRYIVCHNEEQARKDRADRDAILSSLRNKLKQGAKSLVGNKGYRKYLKGSSMLCVDEDKVKAESRYDGKWVLRTNTNLPAEEVALKYKQLLMVEDIFRNMKSLLETRPIYHKCDDTIRGHVFCSFLALVLRKELQDRLEDKGWDDVEWADIVKDLDDLHETEIQVSAKDFIVRDECRGVSGKAIQAARAALPPTVRQVN